MKSMRKGDKIKVRKIKSIQVFRNSRVLTHKHLILILNFNWQCQENCVEKKVQMKRISKGKGKEFGFNSRYRKKPTQC